MDGSTIIALSTLGPAVITLAIYRWRHDTKVSKSIGRVEGLVDGLAKAVNSRLEASEKRTDHLEERFNDHLRNHAREVQE